MVAQYILNGILCNPGVYINGYSVCVCLLRVQEYGVDKNATPVILCKKISATTSAHIKSGVMNESHV